MTTFNDLGLSAPILKALAEEKYETPTPIQAQAIPHVITGRDLLGIAQTGTGKTAAFALPILNRLAADPRPTPRRSCRALILSPTRELASQIADSFKAYGRHLRLSTTVIFGGVSPRAQIQSLARGVDILVATPGRLLDHAGSGVVSLDKVELFVLDEADQMLDLGFIHAIRKLVRMLPAERQSLFFSATMPKEIGQLAGELLRNPERVAVTPVATPVETIDQRVIFVDTPQKRSLLAEILGDANMGRTLVFTRTKHGADRVVRHLESTGIDSAAIHGNKSQSQRERALGAFREGRTKVLIATDIAARGIDVDGVTHVINFDLPNIPESYVHRIGRTARAGASGVAISFCDGEERAYLRDIEKLIRRQIPATDRRVPGAEARVAEGQHDERPKRHGQSRRDGGRNGGRNGARNGHGHGGHNGSRHEGSRHEGARHEGGRNEQRDRHPPRDRSGQARPQNGAASHAEARRDNGHDRSRDNGGAAAYGRPAGAAQPSRKFRRGGAPRRMGV
ncbi:MAG TPA: DEAD/DEAH box helicase [Alphaproteobacteria bacterium]|nr:DEAD/DEAH box helicase [Alphaproteobacteria bacterium]